MRKLGVISAIFFSGFILLLVFQCKKDEKKAAVTYPPNPQPDSIYYKDISPDIELNSVRTMSTYWSWSGTCTVCVPTDSTAKDTLRSCVPVSFLVHSLNGPHGSGCPPVECFMSMNMLQAGDSVVIKNGTYFYSYGDTIKLAKCVKQANIRCYAWNCSPILSFTGEKYVGFKRNNNSGVYYGWVLLECFSDNGLRIKEYAINKTPGNIIKAGQKN